MRSPIIYRLDKDGYYKGYHDGVGNYETYGFLHRIVWIENFGPIPKGFDVHHKDENRENNVPDNLELVPRGEHMAMHRRVGRPRECICEECGVVYVSRAMKPTRFCCIKHGDRFRKKHYRRLKRGGEPLRTTPGDGAN